MEPLVKESFDLGTWLLGLISSLFGGGKKDQAAQQTAQPQQPAEPEMTEEEAVKQWFSKAPETVRPWLYRQQQRPTFSQHELEQGRRMGMPLEEMSFMPTMAKLMRGLKARDKMMTNVTQGKEMFPDEGYDEAPESVIAEATRGKTKMPMPQLPGRKSPTDTMMYT